MGMQLEFNWYLVLRNEPEELTDGHWQINSETQQEFVPTGVYYRTSKNDARIYPIGGVVPIIQDNKAIGMAHIRECSQRLNSKNKVFTVIDYDKVMDFQKDDPVAHHYTDLYHAYKKKQEVEDHGGKFKTEEFVNALGRRSFEEILAKAEGE